MRYFISVSYDGTKFHGSQIQGDLKTVQLLLNQAVSTLLRTPIQTFGASRTDKDVHARQNFYHFDFEGELPREFLYKLNAILPFEIAVNNCQKASDPANANARFDALNRSYRYWLHTQKDPFENFRSYYYPYKLNRELLTKTAEILIGKHDFTSYSKRNTQTYTFICTVEKAEWSFEEDRFCFEVKANRFLRGMVRSLVGTQLKVARGKMSFDQFEQLFELKDCRLADFSVPGFGLYLEQINYPESFFVTEDTVH